MDYGKYLSEKMDINRRNKYYHDLLYLKDISKSLPQDMIEYLHMTYKYETIEECTKQHHKYLVLRELRVKLYYSKYMYRYFVELYADSLHKSNDAPEDTANIVITRHLPTT